MILSSIREWRRKKRESKIRKAYKEFCTALGDALSYLHLADTAFQVDGVLYGVRDPETYHKLRELEIAYAGLGYRIIPLSVWVDHGGWGVSLIGYWRIPREEGERPEFTTFTPDDLPTPSPMLKIMEETGKPVEAIVDEDGETTYRVVEDA